MDRGRMRYTSPISPVTDTSGGDLLRAKLKSEGVSQAELCRRTGLSENTVRALVHGRRDGNVATWRAIARALRCGIDDIRG